MPLGGERMLVGFMALGAALVVWLIVTTAWCG
jgi:hypothetical protein